MGRDGYTNVALGPNAPTKLPKAGVESRFTTAKGNFERSNGGKLLTAINNEVSRESMIGFRGVAKVARKITHVRESDADKFRSGILLVLRHRELIKQDMETSSSLVEMVSASLAAEFHGPVVPVTLISVESLSSISLIMPPI